MKSFNIVLAAVAVSMLGASTFAATELTPEQSLEVRKAVVTWLECEECTEGELERLLRYGELAVPTLAAVLERGPSPATSRSIACISKAAIATWSSIHARMKK